MPVGAELHFMLSLRRSVVVMRQSFKCRPSSLLTRHIYNSRTHYALTTSVRDISCELTTAPSSNPPWKSLWLWFYLVSGFLC